MNILVVNGSPKGQYSITLQTIRYLETVYPDHKFEVLNAGAQIKALEKDFSSAVQLTHPRTPRTLSSSCATVSARFPLRCSV